MLALIFIFFATFHSFLIQAQEPPSSTITCTIVAYTCASGCSDSIEEGPFEVTYHSNDTTITIFEGEMIEGVPVRFTFSPHDEFIVGEFESGKVMTKLNHHAQTILVYQWGYILTGKKWISIKGNALTTYITCE